MRLLSIQARTQAGLYTSQRQKVGRTQWQSGVFVALASGAVGDPIVGDHRHKSSHPLDVSNVSVTPSKGKFVGVFRQMLT
jgi:hypothetical protein